GTTKRAFLIATNSNYICKDSSTIAIKAKALASAADDQGNSLLRAFVKKAQWQRALNLIHHMQRDQTTPDMVSFNSTLSACEKGNRWEYGLHFFSQLQTAGNKSGLSSTSSDWADLSMDHFTFSILMKLCSHGKLWREALEILKASDVHIDLVGWNALMAVCEKSFAWPSCLHLLATTSSFALQADLVSLNTTLSACARTRGWQLSLHLLSESLLTNLQPDIISYNSVITACSGHHWPLALHLLFFSRQARLVPSIISFNAAIAACDKGHQWQKALQLFQDLQEEHVSPTRVTYNSLLSACEVGLPWSSLLHLLSLSQHLPEHRGEADAWAAVASACAKTLAWAVALDALEVIRMTMPEAAWHATLRACALALKWRSALVLLHQGQCQQLQMPRSSDVSSLLVAARGERWSTAEGGRPFHAWQLEEVRRAAVQADESVEETNPNAQLARAALNSLHVVRTKSVLTCGCKGMQKSSSFPVRDGKRVLFRMIFFLLQGGVEQSMLTGSCLVSWISFPAPPASIPNPLARSELDFEMASASEDKTLDLEQLVDKIEAPTCPNVVPKMHPSA
ncbi:unnamed protein product, partial [Durusdinium trenchii]